jgi:2-succinyl-5-enolpyruvyl-6-hydroxy-3-cyclohexene-1-carboxylate synthase
MNEEVTYQVIQTCILNGVREFIVCAGSRNSSFIEALRIVKELKTYYWSEERSAAFFALGRSKFTGSPVAVVTTSGTAAVELFPATMEAYYTGVPLVLITADRPQTFRGSGAPQSAEQVGLFGRYVEFCLDITPTDPCLLDKWQKKIPVHLNVCLEEPQKQPKFQGKKFVLGEIARNDAFDFNDARERLNSFFNSVKQPIAIVSTLKPEAREGVVRLLQTLEIPVMIEGISGLREDVRLQHLSIRRTDKVIETAAKAGYSIDGILRIGGIPTHRIWRDLEYLEKEIRVCGLSERPFSGLSWSRCVAEVPIAPFLQTFIPTKKFGLIPAAEWLRQEKQFETNLFQLFEEEPQAEPSLMYSLSKQISKDAHVYLGNSLPIREWDLAAQREDRGWIINANRGVNGIDGQLSTFLGMCQSKRDNWGVFGDLTTLYDMAAPWILPQLKEISLKLVIINNGGGKIFERMYLYKEMLNEHTLSFRPFAEMWGFNYLYFESLANVSINGSRQLIEIVPDSAATSRFWTKYAIVDQKHAAVEYASTTV